MKKIFFKIIKYIEILTKTKIVIKKINRNSKNSKAASDGESMSEFCSMLEKFSIIIPKNVFEIGANFGQDAEYLRKRLNLDKSDIYIFEPHPQIIEETKKIYGFNCYALAISNKNGKMNFNAINLDKNTNSGISSLREHKFNKNQDYYKIEVEVMRMDSFIENNNITSIDFLKIDVEGATYEVLMGFGSKLKIIKAIHLEAENTEVWKGQYLFKDIYKLLTENDFELVSFELKDSIQSDSFWIRKNLLQPRYFNK